MQKINCQPYNEFQKTFKIRVPTYNEHDEITHLHTRSLHFEWAFQRDKEIILITTNTRLDEFRLDILAAILKEFNITFVLIKKRTCMKNEHSDLIETTIEQWQNNLFPHNTRGNIVEI
jgi:hypothetical protein